MTVLFEDIEIGETIDHGSIEVTREQVIDFASKFDPQPFHLSDEGAVGTPFGRMAASGWHTCALVMRVIADSWKRRGLTSSGSPGHDELRWLKPVFPGDTINVETTITDKRPSRSRPEIGSVWANLVARNQHGDDVLRYKLIFMIARRASDQSPQ